ncbi:putative disease resistance protein [Senna tora]|uniref:Putative disease resistance protein n=1 Tax=Senna tora TaxID=362788 RepID=A0A834W4M0_9FABA|nr:putative disease resistance protein [Senna tora]
MKLENLSSLKSFCSYNYTFMFPSLDKLLIMYCRRMSMFCAGDIHAPLLKGMRWGNHEKLLETNLNKTTQLLFTQEGLTLNQKNATMIRDGEFQANLFDKVRTLCLESFVDESVTFPYSFLGRFPNLQELCVEHSCFEEIIPSEAQIVNHMGKIASFKELYVGYLDQLKTIWNDDSQLQPIHQDLKRLEVECCGRLIKLTPSFVSFENLTHLKVCGCHQLIYLVTSSTAKSLVNLQRLEISDCERMEEIVRNNESEDDVEATIRFYSLWRLQLTDLRSLKSFCSQNHHTFKFPSLQYDVSISGCQQMKMFCGGVVETPKLSNVKIDEDRLYLEGGLNKTIEMAFLNKV